MSYFLGEGQVSPRGRKFTAFNHLRLSIRGWHVAGLRLMLMIILQQIRLNRNGLLAVTWREGYPLAPPSYLVICLSADRLLCLCRQASEAQQTHHNTNRNVFSKRAAVQKVKTNRPRYRLTILISTRRHLLAQKLLVSDVKIRHPVPRMRGIQTKGTRTELMVGQQP